MALMALVSCGRIPWLKKRGWRWFYQYLATKLPDDFSCMNYGYAGATEVDLDIDDESERYGVQLYHHLADMAGIEGQDILDVGCGRGGGISYLSRYMRPRTAVGLDLSERGIALCRTRHQVNCLKFVQGDSENLPFADESFDSVFNVESAFCYPSREKFYREVFRVLRPHGHFLYADIEDKSGVGTIEQNLERSGFVFARRESINEPVIKACDLDSQRRRQLVDALYDSWIFRTAFYNYAAVPNTYLYRQIKSGNWQYVCNVLTKPS